MLLLVTVYLLMQPVACEGQFATAVYTDTSAVLALECLKPASASGGFEWGLNLRVFPLLFHWPYSYFP